MFQHTLDNRLQGFVSTDLALAGDLEGHVAMISPDVMAFGVPGFDTLGHDDWYWQFEYDFPQHDAGVWRLNRLRILPEDAARHDSLL